LITNVSKQRKKFNTAMLSSWYPAYTSFLVRGLRGSCVQSDVRHFDFLDPGSTLLSWV